MNLACLIDPVSALIVVGGTGLATFMRCGAANVGLACSALAQLGRKRFDASVARAEMAVQVQEIQQDGLLRAQPHHFGDAELDDAADALIAGRSVKTMIAAHERHKARRVKAAQAAASTLAQGSELAPVFGLAGTLISLSQLHDGLVADDGLASAISMAVLTTLYGLLLANLVLAPLARMVERAASDEEAERQKIIDWLAWHIERATPRRPVATKATSLDEAA